MDNSEAGISVAMAMMRVAPAAAPARSSAWLSAIESVCTSSPERGLGSMMPSGPASTTPARSSCQYGVSSALMRT
jgi:hypothetical protein